MLRSGDVGAGGGRKYWDAGTRACSDQGDCRLWRMHKVGRRFSGVLCQGPRVKGVECVGCRMRRVLLRVAKGSRCRACQCQGLRVKG